MTNKTFYTNTKFGNIQFEPKNSKANVHTVVSLKHLVQLTGVHEKIECDIQIFNSPSIYINADNFVSGAKDFTASIFGIEGIDTIKKLNFLGAENSGIYFHFPGYKFKKHDLCKLYNWLNSGIICFESNRCLKSCITNPLAVAKG